MDLNQKQEYNEGIDDYLEEYKVYDYFYELMKEILIHRPKNPIEFLIERISKSETKR
jgi:adenylate kinase